MSDIVLGALIGVCAAALGAIITGFINYKNAKLQLSYQKGEAQRNRLIEARKELLLDLRRTISEWVDCSNKQVAMIVRLDKAVKNKESPLVRKLEIKEFNEVSERMKQLSSQFNILRSQVSDNRLADLIEVVRETEYEVNTKRLPLIRFFNNPGSVDANTFESVFQKDESLIKELLKQVLQVNKRIEELLSGAPST